MIGEIDYKRLYWHSRRGMLELDLILIPFVRERLQKLAEAEQILYQDLLEEEDPDLYSWLLGRVCPPTENLQKIVEIILDR